MSSYFLKNNKKNWAENTYVIHKGKYHFMADSLFYWFGFNQTSKSVDILTYLPKAAESKPVRRLQ